MELVPKPYRRATATLLSLVRKAAYKAPRRPARRRPCMAHASAVAAKGAKQDDAQTRQFWPLALGAIGVVYGDIGTSPIYAFREAVVAATGEAAVVHDTVLGILSLIVWSLFLLVTLKYVFVLLRADFNGEGGTFALMALAQSVAQRSKHVILLLGIAGASFLYGDAAITPALSVISAVEGLKVIAPAFEKAVVPLSIVDPDRAVRHAKARHGQGGGPVRPDHPAVVRGHRQHRRRVHRRGAARARRLQSGPRRDVSPAQRPDRVHRARPGLSRRDRRRDALCRPRAFRPQADPGRLAGRGAAGTHPQLPGTGRARARQPAGDREPLLPDVPELGVVAGRPAHHDGHGDRQPGRDHRRLFGHPAGHPARAAAAVRNSPHVGGDGRPDLPAARQLAAAHRRAAAGRRLQELQRAGRRLWRGGDGDDDHDLA